MIAATWTKNLPIADLLPLAAFILQYFVDQGMYAHFRPYYARFESMTRYPKYCRGLGQFQQDPRGILLHHVKRRFVNQQMLEMLLHDGMELFLEQVDELFRNHMPEISLQDFFDKLVYDSEVQIPLLLVMVKPERKDDIVVKAYKSLREAVERRFPKGQPIDLKMQ